MPKLLAKHFGLLVLTVLAAVIGVFYFTQPRFIRHQDAPFLSFNDLRKISYNIEPGFLLKRRLQKFWETPIIDNRAYYHGAKPHRPSDEKLGDYLRVVSWNIEKSFHMSDAVKLFTAKGNAAEMFDPGEAAAGSEKFENAMRQREKLLNADVILLQEMDIGVKRSGYVNAAALLAEELDMNYAFAPEQLEVDPVLLGLEKITYSDGSIDQEATDYFAVDPAKYKGAFGCAVLSRYPIKKVRAFQLATQPYNWNAQELQGFGFLEKTRRVGAKVVFENEITREVKRGGRIFFRVDLHVPGLPEDTLTIINIHLEIKCQPQGREMQMAEILYYIKDIRHPVIVAGDFNAAPEDLSATSVKRVAVRTAKDPTAWFSAATTALLPHALIINTTRFLSNFTKNLQDPLAPDIAVVAPNPVHELFRMIQNYRFADGGAFDFRGDENRSINGKSGALANSNERDNKGFETTFSVKRPVAAIFGKYRLDWVFVKSYLKEPFDRKSTYRFAPHRGETLEEMHTSLRKMISDHHPNVVDIPYEEPKIAV